MVREVNICSFRGVLRKLDGLDVKGLDDGHSRKNGNHSKIVWIRVELKPKGTLNNY